MNMTEIIVAVVTGASLIIVQVIVSSKQQRIVDVKHEDTVAEIKRDIRRLEEKQDKHNSLIERMAIVERDMKTAFKNIDEIKEVLKHEN